MPVRSSICRYWDDSESKAGAVVSEVSVSKMEAMADMAGLPAPLLPFVLAAVVAAAAGEDAEEPELKDAKGLRLLDPLALVCAADDEGVEAKEEERAGSITPPVVFRSIAKLFVSRPVSTAPRLAPRPRLPVEDWVDIVRPLPLSMACCPFFMASCVWSE